MHLWDVLCGPHDITVPDYFYCVPMGNLAFL